MKSAVRKSNGPEFIVCRETFDRYFDRPLPPSTFDDLVKKGLVHRWPGMRGRYYLNASLRRLGLPEVSKLPPEIPRRSMEDIVRFAFHMIDPVVFPAPSWLLLVDEIDIGDADYARRLADQHQHAVCSCSNPVLKIAYFQGVLDFWSMAEHGVLSADGV